MSNKKNFGMKIVAIILSLAMLAAVVAPMMMLIFAQN